MGIVNVFTDLETHKEIYNFNGGIRKNLDLNWEYTKIYKGGEELTPDYEVQENDVITIQELPGALTTGMIIAIGVVAVVAIGTAAYSIHKANQLKRELDDYLKRIGKNNKQPDVSSIPQLSGGRNERADGKQSPIILGRHLFTPYFLSEPYMRPEGEDGEDLYFYAALLAGQNGLVFEKIRNGTTDLAEFTGNIPQREIKTFGSGEDPFQGSLEIVQKGNENSINSFSESVFEQKWVDSLDSTVEIARKKAEAFQTTVDNLYILDFGEDPVIRATARFPMRAEIEIFLDGLFGWDSEAGVAVNAGVDIRLEWSTNETGIGNSIALPYPWEPEGLGYRLIRNKTMQMRFIAEVNFPSHIYSAEGNPVFIRATRLSRMHNGGRDQVYFSALRTQQYNPRTSSITQLIAAKNLNEKLTEKFCRVGIKLKVNNNTEEALDRFNIIASMSGRTWNGQSWSGSKVKTSNSAAVALEVLTGLIHDPSKIDNSEIDLLSFGKLYEYCQNQKVMIQGEGEQMFNLEANGVIINTAKKLDVLNQVLQTCDAGLYINEYGKMIVYYDDYQSVPVALLNPQRIVRMNEQRNLNRRTDGYMVEFIDAAVDWSQDVHRILRPRVQEDLLNTFTSLKLDFTTSYKQAMWHARRIMAKEIHRPGEIKVVVGKEGRYYKPGSLIKVQNERFKIGIGSGEIVSPIIESGMITGLKLMERFDIASDRDYFVEYYVVDEKRNHVVHKQIQSAGQYTDRLMFTIPISVDSYDAPVMGNILSAVAGEPAGVTRIWESKRYIVTGLSENEDGYDLALAAYSDEIYRTTEIDDIPEYRSHIMNAPPRIYNSIEDRQLISDNRQLDQFEVDQIATGSVEREVPRITPRYRGATNNPDLENTGIINGNEMNIGDYIMYIGNPEGIWQTARMYEWTGTDWVLLIPEENWNRYLDGVSDITAGVPDGVFSNAFIKTLFAQTVNAEYVNVRSRLKLAGGGVIQSEDYDPGSDGFIIKANGDVELNNAIFRGTLEARYIKVTGTVSSGTQFILRANNNLSIIQPFSNTWLAASFVAIAKEIKTLAKGSCLIRMTFPLITSESVSGNMNYGFYRITVNDNIIRDWTSYYSSDSDLTIDIPNISLTNEINYIKLFGRPAQSPNLFNFVFVNTIFELRCAEDPSFLAVLG